MARRTSRKIASRTSRSVKPNVRRTRAQIRKEADPINEKIAKLQEQRRDRMYELMHEERWDDWEREKVKFDEKIEALEAKTTRLDHEWWAAKKNPLRSNGGKRVSKRGGGDFRRFEDAAREAGWEVEHTRSGHMVFRSPDKSVPPVYLSGDIGAPRQIKNVEALLRRAGLETSPSRMKRNGDDDEPSGITRDEWQERLRIARQRRGAPKEPEMTILSLDDVLARGPREVDEREEAIAKTMADVDDVMEELFEEGDIDEDLMREWREDREAKRPPERVESARGRLRLVKKNWARWPASGRS